MTYEDLSAKVDRLVASLRKRHELDLACRKGCSSCCTDITVRPVEWAYLKQKLGAASLAARNSDSRKCPFLARGEDGEYCAIYESRPLICRIHGLPQSYPVEEYDNLGNRVYRQPPERHLMWCELNFLDLDKFDPRLPESDVFDMVWYQRQIEEIDAAFCKKESVDASLVSLRVGTGRIARLDRDQ